MFGIKFFVFVIMALMALTAQVTVASPFVDRGRRPPSNNRPNIPIITNPPFNPNAKPAWG